jgi:hypothetical protein
MKKMKPSIKNASDLKHHQALLRMQVSAKEDELNSSWAYLRGNYKTLVWREINPLRSSGALSTLAGMLHPSLLPLVSELTKGTVKGRPFNLKVLGEAVKFAIASFGIKWLKKLIESKEEESEQHSDQQPPESN